MTTKLTILLVSFLLASVTAVHAAGAAAATSGYVTIQPNIDNTGYVYTFSWVAPDTDNAPAGAVAYTDTRFSNPFGNSGANLDSIETRGGNYVGTDDPIHHPSGYYVKYAWAMGQPGDEATPANEDGSVGYQDPLNTTIAYVAPTTATPKFDTSGNWTTLPSFYVASGVQGVTGIYGADPDGSDALPAGVPGAIHQGVGFGVDTDGGDDPNGVDDFGPIIAGFDAILDVTPTNTMPNTGYVQVNVPFPSSGNDFTNRFHPGVYTENAAIELTVTTNANYVPKLAVAADFNSDFAVDSEDVTHVVNGFNGSSAIGKWYADGDCDGDGDVDNLDIIRVAGAVTNAGPDNPTPNLLYDPQSGHVRISADGGKNITGFQLESANHFNSNKYSRVSGGTFGGTFEEISNSVVADSDETFLGGVSFADLGKILAPQLDLPGLKAVLTSAAFSAGLGNSGDFDLIIAPRPTVFCVR